MRFRTILVASAIAVSSTVTAEAKSFSCAADDAWMRLVLEGFIDEDDNMKLRDASGMLAFKAAVVPFQPQGYKLAFHLLTDSSTDGDQLKLRFQGIYPATEPTAPSTQIDLAMTSEAGEDNAVKGQYDIKVGVAIRETVTMAELQQHSGSVFCRYEK